MEVKFVVFFGVGPNCFQPGLGFTAGGSELLNLIVSRQVYVY